MDRDTSPEFIHLRGLTGRQLDQLRPLHPSGGVERQQSAVEGPTRCRAARPPLDQVRDDMGRHRPRNLKNHCVTIAEGDARRVSGRLVAAQLYCQSQQRVCEIFGVQNLLIEEKHDAEAVMVGTVRRRRVDEATPLLDKGVLLCLLKSHPGVHIGGDEAGPEEVCSPALAILELRRDRAATQDLADDLLLGRFERLPVVRPRQALLGGGRRLFLLCRILRSG